MLLLKQFKTPNIYIQEIFKFTHQLIILLIEYRKLVRLIVPKYVIHMIT